MYAYILYNNENSDQDLVERIIRCADRTVCPDTRFVGSSGGFSGQTVEFPHRNKRRSLLPCTRVHV